MRKIDIRRIDPLYRFRAASAAFNLDINLQRYMQIADTLYHVRH